MNMIMNLAVRGDQMCGEMFQSIWSHYCRLKYSKTVSHIL